MKWFNFGKIMYGKMTLTLKKKVNESTSLKKRGEIH